MKRAHAEVAREIAHALRDPTRADFPALAKRWLLKLAPPRKRRTRDPIKGARRATLRELDDLCRRLVRARDGGKCRHCGGTDRQLQTCHVFPKSKYRSVRHDLDNLFLGCAHCHMNWWHKDPLGEGAAWWRGEIGPAAFDRLKLRAQAGRKAEAAVVRFYLLAEAKRLGVEVT